MDWLSWLIVAICVVWFIYDKLIKNRDLRSRQPDRHHSEGTGHQQPNPQNATDKKQETETKPRPEAAPAEDTVTNYRRIPLLTAYEQQNYLKLRSYAAEHDLVVCPKIRLADLVEPKPNRTRAIWQKHFNMICSKHVDFTLCDQYMNVKVIIELDDWSHLRRDRQARDQFVDTVLKNSGYKIIHIPVFTSLTVTELNKILGITEVVAKPEPEIKPAIRTEPTYEEWKAAKLAEQANQEE